MISKEKKAEIIAAYGRTAEDTGSPEVQVALLTESIRELTDHLKGHPKDHHYLKRNDIEGYRALIERLGIRK